MQIEINSQEEGEIKNSLEKRTDPEAKRLLRFLNMPDLSREPESPIYELVGRILKIPRFADFDDIKVPEIAPPDVSFDLFNFPAEHPARSKSDTYFINGYVLRTHTTIMWYYWLKQPEVMSKIEKGESVGALSYGKVYRKDEIDRNHMNVFHQMDGWYLSPKEKELITVGDLKNVLVQIARAIYGSDIKYRFNKDEFPYTDPSIEMEIKIPYFTEALKGEGGRWVEVLGAGVVHPVVLKNLGVDPDKYNGWAFGFGLERLAILSMDLPDIRLLWSEDERMKKQLKLGNKFKEVSKYPAITRDISFVQKDDFVENDYFDLMRDEGGNIIEEVKRIDTFKIPKGAQMEISGTFRIVYRSIDRTLTNAEVDKIQDRIYKKTADKFAKEIR